MHDRELCLEVLRQIEGAAIKISNQTATKSGDSFC